MSAYICNPEHFGILAAYAVQHDCGIYDWTDRKAEQIQNAQRIAKGLASENVRSVAHRYPNSLDNLPGQNLSINDIYEAAAIYAAHFVTHQQKLRPIDVLKLCQGLDYQSCETNDWRDTLAWRQIDWIKNEAIRSLPGYEGTDWSFNRPIPAIEALYERVAP